MAHAFDLVIRSGTVADGKGGEPFEGDVAVSDGKIVAVGKFAGNGREEIDAKGLLVTPGFVDIHTHYDGQVTWENRLVPSSAHGITTAVMGNCGVGFAPCRPDQHELLIRLMEGVEDIPHPVLVEGLKWNWESFPDYLNVLAGRHYDMDIANYVPHAALRVYVMGERGVNREPATEEDRNAMAEIVRQSVKAGAIGFATSRLIFHRSSDGKPIPTYTASEEELTDLALALKDCGAGVIQVVSDFNEPVEMFGLLRRLAERSGRPLSYSLGTPNTGPGFWRELLELTHMANNDGLKIKAQVMDRAIGIILGHELTMTPFSATEGYRALAGLSFAQKIAELRRPEVRARILNEPAKSGPPTSLADMARNFASTFELGDPPNYEPAPEDSIAGRAARRGVRPDELCYDLLLEKDGRNQLYLAFANFPDGNLDAIGEMMRHPDTILGLADGGAHCGTICDGGYSTFLLTHWTRDRRQGERLAIGTAVKALSKETAEAVGLFDRGRLAPGYKADINVIDHAKLRLHPPELVANLPAGGRRLLQRADGYRTTIVTGQVTYRDGAPTDVLPGRLVRGGQRAPQ